jgi:hypothetical protein
MVVGQVAMQISDQTLPVLKVSLSELGNQSPISGATVTASLLNNTLVFQEESIGVYSTSLPAEMVVGDYDIIIEAQKDGIALYPHQMRLLTKANWQIKAPERIEVSLGEPFEIDFEVEGSSADRFKAIATMGDKELTIRTKGSGMYAIAGPSAITEQAVKLKVAKIGGLAQEATILVLPGGGRVVPLESELRGKAGQVLEIKARFYGKDGSLLTGEHIPYSQVFAGLLTSELFSDPDGDGIATTAITNLLPGNYTLTLWADGCDMVDVKAVVEWSN